MGIIFIFIFISRSTSLDGSINFKSVGKDLVQWIEINKEFNI